MATASSAARTKGASRSGSAYTATVAIPIARQVRMTRAAISARLAIRIFAIRSMALHPEDAEGVGAPDDLVERGAERDAEGGPRVARVDDAVVPDAGRRVERVRLLLDLLLDRPPHGLVLRLVVGLPGALGGPAPDDGQHAGQLLGPHHRHAVVRPGEQEARLVRPPAHPVVAGAVGAADHDGEHRHGRVRDRVDHLGAVLNEIGRASCRERMYSVDIAV